MTVPQITILAVLVVLFAVLVWGRWRYDIVAFGILSFCVLAGLVPASEAFSGFGHPATVTVALVLILSRGLAASGATDIVARAISPATVSHTGHIASLAGVGAVLSAFMNNVGTLGLLMPVALTTGKRAGRAAAVLLMPLSFGCILGGLITLIGTPPNIIVAAYRGQATGESFGMFDFTPVGLAVAAAGVAFVALIGWRLVPSRATEDTEADFFEIDNYLTEARVPEASKAVGKTTREIEEMTKDTDAQIVGMVRAERPLYAPRWMETVRTGDILMIEAGPEALDLFVGELGLELVDSQGGRKILDEIEESQLVEAVVVPHSRLEGRTVAGLGLPHVPGINLLAVSRQGRPYRGRLRAFRFRAGDVLLMHGHHSRLSDFIGVQGCLPLRERQFGFGGSTRPLAAVGFFAGAIALASTGLVPVAPALGLAVLGMIATKILPLRDLYESVDWPVIILLAALIPVGGALETTGASG
ncbi:MAG: SLC13 family permease, partial [Alphaproteobacteria bacterium]|nr:SLC13 family permease [Alphaproteobacteria bacterium]